MRRRSRFDGGKELLKLSEEEMRRIRGRHIAMIFQEPMTSLNPVLRIGLQIMEPLTIHLGMDEKAARARAMELLTLVGITDPESRLSQYPHQLSGGMRQRVMIAIGLACNPKLLIADEPTTALDVTIQAQILELMKDLSRRLGVSVVIITHNLGIVARYADRVNVMYAARLAESGTAELAVVVGCHVGTPEQSERDLEPLRRFGSPVEAVIGPMEYTAINSIIDPAYPRGALMIWAMSSPSRSLGCGD